ncbi:outer membrane beta-barrel protein [Chitinophaga arvensicola]|uniref:Carboxypeptidase regulatory-like domain-containing protein n=1 Tax=Chitinophaga arvensicola TaxID=29529 RepID=A0A1I0S7K9_9BACT|nr:outer membrane beta-barrel protein [Chitinophaga arvensicola]SEW51752.1 Carboxypeptidase regulatory-like domain-containing protein [Chitinophaga arvensicola]
MQKYFGWLFLCLFSFAAHAQHGTIKGTISDTVAGRPVVAATITLLQKKDSSLVSFTMTNERGHFEILNVPAGEYRLLITHVNYQNQRLPITISATAPAVNLPGIVLHDRSRMLNEVEISGEAPPVTLIGDTVQYNAGSFRTPPNASVEQLLKKLPGVQVGKDGSVKAQGQKVNRVLVDGKEFFGSDPKMATKNLPADAIDKVQVYDKLSNAAQLTGFDDGNSEKTINLKLKAEKKKGMFGKAMAGGGTDDRYEGRFNLNSFKGARQLSVLGMANNINAEGFSFMDMMNFSGEMAKMGQGGSGNSSFALSAANPAGALSGGNSGNGITTALGGGVNYNNLIGKKTEFTSSYFYNRYNPQQESDIKRQYFLPDSSYFYNQHTNSNNLNNSHRVNLGADIQVDSLFSIKITSTLGYQDTQNKNESSYETLSQDQQLTNQGFSKNSSSGHGTNFSNEVLFRKKFRRKGRTLSLTLQNSLNNSESNGSLLSVNHFFNRPPSQPGYDSIHQQNTISGNLNSYNARTVYTEPLGKRSLLELSLGNSHSKSTSDKTTYDYNPHSGQFDQLNPALTNNFENTYSYTNAGFRLRTKQKKFSLAAGLNWQAASLEGKIIAGKKDSVIGKNFYNLLPSLRFQYDFSRYRNLSINYVAMTNQPDMSQLQPVPDISDPLNIREGNPLLKPELTHAMQLNFISVNPFQNKNLFAFFTLQETQNKIVSSDMVDSSGVKRSRPVNVNGVFNMSGSVSAGFPLKALKGTVNFSSNIGYGSTKQFINMAVNNIQTVSVGPSVRFDLTPTPKLDLSFNAGVNYYKSNYSLQPSLNSGYFSQQYETDINWQLPASFYFNTNFMYMVNSRRADGFNAKVPVWNASLSRQFLRYQRGELKLSVNDLLNENVGINRSTNQNYIEDSRTRNLQRFFMLSFTYSLSKMGNGAAPMMQLIRH